MKLILKDTSFLRFNRLFPNISLILMGYINEWIVIYERLFFMPHSTRIFKDKSLIDLCIDAISQMLKNNLLVNFRTVVTIPNPIIVAGILKNCHDTLVKTLISDEAFKAVYQQYLLDIPKQVTMDIEKAILDEQAKESAQDFYRSCR